MIRRVPKPCDATGAAERTTEESGPAPAPSPTTVPAGNPAAPVSAPQDTPFARALVFHDLNPMSTPFAPLLLCARGAEINPFEGGSERRPAGIESVFGAFARQPDARVISVRYIRPALGGDAGNLVRSVISVGHPIVRMLHRIQHTWTRFADAQAERLPADAALAAVLAGGLMQPLQKFPYSNFHVGLITGDLQLRSRASGVGLAAAVLKHAGVALADIPQSVVATTRRELAHLGIEFDALAPETDTQPQAILDTLQHWAGALPEATWARLCRLNAADLAFFDEIAASVVRDADLPEALREEIRRVCDECAKLTTQHEGRVPVPVRSNDARGPNTLIEPDPILGWRLRASQSVDLKVVDEVIAMQCDASGCRPVPGQPALGERTLSVYGCSCVFGWAVPAEETFCARLQAQHPGWRVENHGVNGYGQGQNLLQLTRDLRWNEADLVTFCWIAPHLTRNVGDVIQVQHQTEKASAEKASLIRFMPRAVLDENGEPGFREVAYSRPELAQIDLADFSPDPYYLDLVCAALLRRAAALVRQRGGHFFVTVLMDALSPNLARLLAADDIPVIDASVAGPDYINPFGLSHPNAHAHRHYAERIGSYLAKHARRVPA